ncbi:MAG: glucosamine-6-phosphate deaminase [Phycisphaeraceae bacterium]
MKLQICNDAQEMGACAAASAGAAIRNAIAKRGRANIIVATGASQFHPLDALVADAGIDWSVVTGFHLDEYLDLPQTHPASFRRYLRERLVDRVPIDTFHYVNGEAADPHAECERLGALIAQHPIDVAMVGIGENAHLAFNDPPADFETEEPYLVVDLDRACRQQQFGEGWFESLDAVPKRAISMSVQQILKSRTIVVSAPDARKASAVHRTIEGPVRPDVPASILQRHDRTLVYIDAPAGSKLSQSLLGARGA